MSVILVGVLIIGGIIVILPMLQHKKDKLFQRLLLDQKWLLDGNLKDQAWLDALMKKSDTFQKISDFYEIDFKEPDIKACIKMAVEAAFFDAKRPTNFGISVAEVVVSSMKSRLEKAYPKKWGQEPEHDPAYYAILQKIQVGLTLARAAFRLDGQNNLSQSDLDSIIDNAYSHGEVD